MSDTLKICTYRFNLSKDLMDELTYFSKLHQFDDRKTFKEEWIKWRKEEENDLLINLDIERLTIGGYIGNIEEKIFKSVRYYFKKKHVKESPPSEPKKRKEYENLSENLLKKIDEHIYEELNSHIISKTKTIETNILLTNISPAHAYASFCEKNKELISEEIYIISKKYPEKVIIAEELSNKFKKTYKNRFFNIRVLLENR